MKLGKKLKRGRKKSASGASGAKQLRTALAHHQAGRLRQAEKLYCALLAREPGHADALHYLGVLCHQRGEQQQARKYLDLALSRSPQNPDILNNLAIVHKTMGRPDKALDCYDKALHAAPSSFELHNNMGNVLTALGRIDEALEHFDQALTLRPDSVAALVNLGNAYRRQGAFAKALDCYKKARRLAPHDPRVLNNLALAWQDAGSLAKARLFFEQALAVDPEHAEAMNNLGNVLLAQGLAAEAMLRYQEAVELLPDFFKARSNLLLAMNYLPCEKGAVLDKHRGWQQAWAELGHQPVFAAAPETALPERIRVGYVSADFRRHPVTCFVEPILGHHDRQHVEVFCYANVGRPDPVTERLQGQARWRDIFPLHDDDAAELIRKDQIDILVDLSGHTQGTRLPLFARGPAPVQATYLGYPNTTGLAAMGYRITDEVSDPAGEEQFYAEKLERLPHGFLCYQPAVEVAAASAPPCAANGFVTFGSFNNPAKMSDAVVRLWVEILTELPDARLRLKYKALDDPAVRDLVLARFERQGLAKPGSRLQLTGFMARPEDHFSAYDQVDIGLDTFPYNGTTTTFEALWMGVPVITLEGDRHAGRVGTSILTHAGLPELIARQENEYVAKAVGLARDGERLSTMRRKLRRQLKNSPLMDGASFCRKLEAAYRKWLHSPS